MSDGIAASIEASFQQALALHQQGRLDAAQSLYQEVLQRQPQHFHALHLLGIIALQSNRAQQAIELFDRALLTQAADKAPQVRRSDDPPALRSDYAAAHYNRGNALDVLKQYEAALDSY